jgi:hypothetical protein
LSRETGTLSLTADASNELVAMRSAPRKSTSSEICNAVREPAPSSNIAAVRLAMPNFPAGSSSAPALMSRFTCASGTACASMIHTGRPLLNIRFWIWGRLT